MEIYNKNNNERLQASKKRFSPSKLVADFNRRYPKIQPINSTKKNDEFTSLFRHANKNFINESEASFFIPKKHTSNCHSSNLSCSSGDTDSSSFDNNRILAIIAKEKYEVYNNLSEFELEDNFNRNLISSSHLSTPFNDDLYSSKRDTSNCFASSSQLSYATNRDVYLEQKLKSDIMTNKQQFKKYKVNDYFFQNLGDFENKFYKKNERLTLTDTPFVSKFQGVEKYGYSDKKKQLSSMVTDAIQKNKDILTRVNKSKRYNVDGFLKMTPVEKPSVFPEDRDLATPPLLNFYNNKPMTKSNKAFLRVKIKKFN